MNPKEAIDDIIVSERITIFSKLSIIMLSLLISPLAGGFVYCANLRYTGQKEKIVGTFITITICNILVLVPFMGFAVSIGFYSPLLFINNIIVTLLMVLILWRKHFKSINYITVFPWIRVLFFVTLYIANTYYNYWLNLTYSFYNPAPSYFVRFNIFVVFALIMFFVFIRFASLLLKRIIKIIIK